MSGDILALALPLCLIIAGLIAAILWIEHEHRKERADVEAQHAMERDELVKVALAPGAAQAALYAAATPEPPAQPVDVYDIEVPPTADFLITDLMEDQN